MLDWIEHILERDADAVVVSVTSVEGSAPREPGATLVLDHSSSFGTVGGGNLEHQALEYARALLVQQAVPESVETKVYALGPSLGQCCGGRVELLFERVTRQTTWVQQLKQGLDSSRNQGGFYWLCRFLDQPVVHLIHSCESKPPIEGLPEQAVSTVVNSGGRCLCQPVSEQLPQVWLFGAGHVGHALVEQLALLPCHTTWLDERCEWLDGKPGASLDCVLTDSPADDATMAPNDTCFIVMTHSHALDFDICHAILRRGQFSWLGLIGSETKRHTFKKRLQQRGIDNALIERLRCPIGVLALQSSEPSSIALSVAAELAQLWEHNVQ